MKFYAYITAKNFRDKDEKQKTRLLDFLKNNYPNVTTMEQGSSLLIQGHSTVKEMLEICLYLENNSFGCFTFD